MNIFELTQHRAENIREVQKEILPISVNDDSLVSAVFVRIPPNHMFPLHVHPKSEDCFFVLSGSGEVFDTETRTTVSKFSMVWVPPGVPHGLQSGSFGAVELGFQAPRGRTIEHASAISQDHEGQGISVTSIPEVCVPNTIFAKWHPAFSQRIGWKYIDPQYSHLRKLQKIDVLAENNEIFIVVVKGKVRLREQQRDIDAISMIHFNIGESEIIHALEQETMLIRILAHGT